MRSADERRIDAALLLVLWARSAPSPREDAGDKLRQMKLAYLTARELAEAQMQALHLGFYRWTWGPLSNEVYDAWDDLTNSGLLEPEEHFVLPRAGQEFATAFYNDVLRDEGNVIVRETADRISEAWRDRPRTSGLMRHVYALEVALEDTVVPVPIRDIAKGTPLLEPVPDQDARGSLTVTAAWRETLALSLKPSYTALVAHAVSDYQAGRVRVG